MFTAPDGRPVHIPPLLFVTLIDHLPGVELFQVVQTDPATLRIRLLYQPDVDPARQDGQWRSLSAELTALLHGHGLGDIALIRAAEPPQQSSGGKFRLVIPLDE